MVCLESATCYSISDDTCHDAASQRMLVACTPGQDQYKELCVVLSHASKTKLVIMTHDIRGTAKVRGELRD